VIPEFRFAVVHLGAEGDKYRSRFVTARSTLDWVNHLKEEGVTFSLYSRSVNGEIQTPLQLADLKTFAKAEKQPPKRKKR
jgi:hypothetical protein